MSWHHEDYISLIAALGGVVSAVAAAYAANQSRKISFKALHQQEAVANFERAKHIQELLNTDAIRANDIAKSVYPNEMNFAQAANMSRALDSARVRIVNFSFAEKSRSMNSLKSYFIQLLSEEVSFYMKGEMPYFLQGIDISIDNAEVHDSWVNSRRFFNFRYCEDSDLSD